MQSATAPQRIVATAVLAFMAVITGSAVEKKSYGYTLGPGDELRISVLELEDFPEDPVQIGPTGLVDLPLVGSLHAAGLTVQQFGSLLRERLTEFMQEPKVTVSVVQYRSQPVSVLGAVQNPGVYQLQGSKTLVEVLSMAGGLRSDAGNSVILTRRSEWGEIPLAGVRRDTGSSVAELSISSILEGRQQGATLEIMPKDVVSVPAAKLIYVVGDVHKAGGFPLRDRSNLSVLEALSLAEGLQSTAAAQNARILRPRPGSVERTEIPVDLKSILRSRASDVALQPNDILFVPGSNSKKVGIRAIEAAIQLGTGVVIWRGR